jgi:antitoxin component YwqK of YwqJK toxin-antitoxin module
MLKLDESVEKIIKNGTYKVINRKTGKLKLVKNYLNDLLHGEYVYYWDNGNIRFRGKYEKSQRIGIWRNFNKNGDVILEEICRPSKFFPIPLEINCPQPSLKRVGNEFSHS